MSPPRAVAAVAVELGVCRCAGCGGTVWLAFPNPDGSPAGIKLSAVLAEALAHGLLEHAARLAGGGRA